jgi:hypothetical protein
MRDPEIDRLLRAAAAASEGLAAEMPFGFDTRVVALTQAERGANETWQFARLVRRIAIGAMVVTACASAAAYWQMNENDELGEPLTNAYAIADNAIDLEVFQ